MMAASRANEHEWVIQSKCVCVCVCLCVTVCVCVTHCVCITTRKISEVIVPSTV